MLSQSDKIMIEMYMVDAEEPSDDNVKSTIGELFEAMAALLRTPADDLNHDNPDDSMIEKMRTRWIMSFENYIHGLKTDTPPNEHRNYALDYLCSDFSDILTYVSQIDSKESFDACETQRLIDVISEITTNFTH